MLEATIWLGRRDRERMVSIGAEAVVGVSGRPNLIASIDELLAPNAVASLKAKGFVIHDRASDLAAGNAAGAALTARTDGGSVELKLMCVDTEGRARVHDSTGEGSVKGRDAILKHAEPVAGQQFQRILQHVGIYHEDGKLVLALLMTFTWPPAGMPGINSESLLYNARSGEVSRALYNTALEHSVALSFGDRLKFAR